MQGECWGRHVSPAREASEEGSGEGCNGGARGERLSSKRGRDLGDWNAGRHVSRASEAREEDFRGHKKTASAFGTVVA